MPILGPPPLPPATSPVAHPLPPDSQGWGTPLLLVAVGGGAMNALGHALQGMVPTPSSLAINTDVQDLYKTPIPLRLQIGEGVTRGLGAGGNPDLGRRAAEEAADEIAEHVAGAAFVVLVAGLGGGTGTGAAPVVGRIARDAGALTIGVPLVPFRAEGKVRNDRARHGLAVFREQVDETILMSNDDLWAERRFAGGPARSPWPLLGCGVGSK